MPSLTKHLRKLSGGLSVKRPGRKDSDQDAVAKQNPVPLKGSAKQSQGQPDAHLARAGSIQATQRDVATIIGDDECDHKRCPPATPALTPDVPVFRDALTGAFEAYGSSAITSDQLTATGETKGTSEAEEEQAALDSRVSRQSLNTVDDRPFTPSILSTLPREVWLYISGYLEPQDAASLAFVNRETADRLGPFFWSPLKLPSNHAARAVFLEPMESKLPDHVLCKLCAIYHARHDPSKRRDREVLRSLHDYNEKPLLATHCNSKAALPSTRITVDCVLPFHLAKLAMSTEHPPAPRRMLAAGLNRTWTPDNSVWADIASSWTVDPTWKHRARFAISKPAQPNQPSQLLMKVTSTYYPRPNLTASEQRLILSCRKDYTANYTTCAHEAKGYILFKACKCALGHIPSGRDAGLASQCSWCRPVYKCVLCPSEYLIQIKLVNQGPRFCHALVVTRWTNLGECRSFEDPEWAACSRGWDYQDTESAIWKSDGETARNLYGEATGEVQAASKAIPLRRPSHWRSESRAEILSDLEDF